MSTPAAVNPTARSAMKKLLSRTFIRQGKEYRVEISLDVEALESKLSVAVTGAVRNQGDEEWDEVTYSAELDTEGEQIVVKYGDDDIASIPLHLPLSASDDPDLQDAELEAEHSLIDSLLDASRFLKEPPVGVETILEALPAPDPFLGCLLKGAVVTVAGQIIRCWKSLDRRRPISYVMSHMSDCFQGHTWNMVTSFMWRSGRCMVLFGFG